MTEAIHDNLCVRMFAFLMVLHLTVMYLQLLTLRRKK